MLAELEGPRHAALTAEALLGKPPLINTTCLLIVLKIRRWLCLDHWG